MQTKSPLLLALALLVSGFAMLCPRPASGQPDTTPPTVVLVNPPPGSTVSHLTGIDVEFSESVSGVDAADLRIEGTLATGVSQITAARYAFTFPSPPDGTVTAAWAPGHGIADLANPPNDFAGGNWTYTLNTVTPPPIRLFINEWLADNVNGIVDPADGQHDDWFEIYNPGTNAVDLGGLYLTDWTEWSSNDFRIPPGYIIPPRGYLLVWADNQPEQNTNTSPHLHVNYVLSSTGGGDIGLYAADGTAVDAISFGAQTPDVSEGRWPDGGTNRYFMTQTTPSATNAIPRARCAIAWWPMEGSVTDIAGANQPSAQCIEFCSGPDRPGRIAGQRRLHRDSACPGVGQPAIHFRSVGPPGRHRT